MVRPQALERFIAVLTWTLLTGIFPSIVGAGDTGRRCLHHTIAHAPRQFETQAAVDTLNYPPDAPLDVIHLSLDLHFPDLNVRQFDGTARFFVRPRHNSVDLIRFDAVDLDITTIRAGRADINRMDSDTPRAAGDWTQKNPLTIAQHYYDGRELWIRLAAPLPAESMTVIDIAYRCTDPRQGLVFALPEGAHANRPLTIHSQGQSEFSRYWFPCLDSPVDRFTSDMSVLVPDGYEVASNGKLLSRTVKPDGDTLFHWWLATSQPAYLVSLVIGQFDIVDDQWRSVPVRYYVPAGSGPNAQRTFGQTPNMMECFSRRLGVDYPYEQYTQCAVFRFVADGMENTAATTLTDTVVINELSADDYDEEPLIAHELAHQWFGDLVTCRSWSDLWLNEGLATFLELIWLEESKGRDDYLASILGKVDSLAAADRSEMGVPLVYRDYADPEETFVVQGGLPYDKGCLLIHMLRDQLGDDLLWQALRLYLTRFREGLVETNDFRKVIEDVSGRSFERFFEQWAYRPGVPEVHITAAWSAETGTLDITVEQKQAITDQRPAFAFPLTMIVVHSGQEQTHSLSCDARINRFSIPAKGEPENYDFDPECALLADLHVEKPLALWLHQLKNGPTIISRIRAARRLGDEDSDEVVNALAGILHDQQSHRDLRLAAADALSHIDRESARHQLRSTVASTPVVADAHVRATVVSLLADEIDEEEIADLARVLAHGDPSPRVQAAALEALTGLNDADSVALMLEKVHVDSHGQDIRRAALSGLAASGDPKALPVISRYAAHGNHDRLRPDAIRNLGRLGTHRALRDQARVLLIPMLEDPEPEAVSAAIEALGMIDDRESRRALEIKRDATGDPGRRSELDVALGSMNGQSSPSAEVEGLNDLAAGIRADIGELADRLRELEEHARPDPFQPPD